LFFAAVLPNFAQTTATPVPGLPKDPREIFAAAAPFYDFSDPALKPWHMKATYQLYNETGDPTEKGTYEYWWASPKVYRSTWTRPNATHTDWHTAEGKHAYRATGERIKFFEYKLQSALLSPLPANADLDPAKIRLDKQMAPLSSVKLPCIMVIPLMPQHGQIQDVPLGMFPTYCFDPQLPVMRISYSFGTVTTEFNHIVKVQDRYLPRELVFYEGKRKILSAVVEAINGLASSDAALTPAADASITGTEKTEIAAGISVGLLVKKQTPVYPIDAKQAHVSGKVVLRATIGMDGGVHDLHVVEAPWPSLVASALWSVSHWEYKPYLLNGEPVEVETTVNVIYTLGN
jgi:hypothetical protein